MKILTCKTITMKHINRILLATVLLTASIAAYSQTGDIAITSFELNPTSLKASAADKKDKAGNSGAAIRFIVKDNHVQIAPNLGVLGKEKSPGEIILYVPKGTKRITITYQGATLREYTIPVEIESNRTYDAVIYISEELLKQRRANSGHVVYASAGYNIVSISGPSIAVGIDINRHNAEIGAILGLDKSDELYFYDGSNNLQAGYTYKAFRAYARYGYDFPLSDFFSVTPQAGIAINSINGSEVDGVNNVSDEMKNTTTLSALAALRLTVSLNDRLKIHLTPEYDFGIAKPDKYKTLSDINSTIKQWTDGFSLNASVAVFF